jgi:NADH/F420H2 dehydrogenase subunit C
MTNEQLKETIEKKFDKATFDEFKGMLNVTVKPEDIHQLLDYLKNENGLKFDFLFSLTGVDWSDSIGIIYHLESVELKHVIAVKCKPESRENPIIPSVTDLWAGAEMHEDEAYDLFGINFTNHPNLRRLMMDEHWNGHPMRKDYVDKINIIDLG